MSGNTIIEQTETIDSKFGVIRQEMIVQVGEHAVNRFGISRIIPMNSAPSKGPVILVPGENTNFGSMDIEDGQPGFATQLAIDGFDVYGYSPRTTEMSKYYPGRSQSYPRHYEDGLLIRTWGAETYASDVNYIQSITTARYPGKKPVIGGFSFGGFLAIATVNVNPEGFAGILLIDGMFISNDPDISQSRISDRSHEPYQPYDDSVGPNFKQMYQYAADQPSDLSPYDGRTPNLQFLMKYSTAEHGLTSEPTPRFVHTSGTAEGFDFFSMKLLGKLVESINYYESSSFTQDAICTWTNDPNRVAKFSGNLQRFRGSIFLAKAGKGVGHYIDHTLSFFHNVPTTSIFNSNYGHFDFFGSDRLDALVRPAEAWMEQLILKEDAP